MKIKTIFNIILVLLTINSFGQQNENEFPSQIKTTKQGEHIRIKGTKVFAIVPSDFQYIKELTRFQKNEDKKLYFQIIESNASSFIQAKPNLSRQVMEAKGAKIDYYKQIQFNEFEGIYFEGPSKYPGETKLMLTFGDNSFVVMVVGVCKSVDFKGKKELQSIMKQIYYDKDLEIDPLELANFEFNTSITNFKYSMTVSNFFMYSQNGKIDVQNPTANSFQIGAMPQMTLDDANSFSKDLLWRYEQSGIALDSKKIKETKINNYPAFVLETKIKQQNKNGIMYQAFLVGENSCILFMGSAYCDLNSLLTKYKDTVESIKIK